jgi:hypothetical protein
MKIRTIIGAASAAIAIATAAPASAHEDVGDKVTPNFAQAIPNIPGKSLIAVIVDYPPGGPRLRILTQIRRSFAPTSFPEVSSRR